jgi:hypothetical protein
LPPALLTDFGNAGVRRASLAWRSRSTSRVSPQIRCSREGRCLAYGNVSSSARAESVKALREILEQDPPDLIGER